MESQFYSTYIILGITVIVSLIGFNNPNFLDKFLFQPYKVREEKQYYRFVTSVFLHGDMQHLIFNCLTFFIFGKYLEQELLIIYRDPIMVQVVYWTLIFGSMITSSIFSYYQHRFNYSYRSLGLSGVACAVLFAMFTLKPDMELRNLFLPIPIKAWIYGILYLAFEIYSNRNRRTNIAHDAHISGAVFGIIFILITNIEQVIKAFQNLL
ncbi:rhomboid family intramembrane serine protease [Fluviicola sp.]|uniref:rhomboid family intramembrane serine protease n=1 Tax=Fluviicola sp. TaxID=1917219 RepID=UPI0031D9183B